MLVLSFWAILLGMRVGLFIVSAFVASTGAALAQSDWVVDPWSLPTRTHESSIAMAVDAPRPAVESRRALASQGEYNSHREWLDEWSELSDPWQTDAATALAASVPAASAHGVPARATRESGDWAKPVPLVVDPWAPEPRGSSAPVVDLIVDPWAHE